MAADERKITIRPNGPYLVRGNIPLVRKSQVMTENGEPIDWKMEGTLETSETYRLCRCGQSKSKPFCDGTHTLVAFDGVETADTGPISSREKEFKGEMIVIRDDHSLCVHAGYCGTRLTDIWELVKDSESVTDLEHYLERYPQGRFAGLATWKLERIELPCRLPKCAP